MGNSSIINRGNLPGVLSALLLGLQMAWGNVAFASAPAVEGTVNKNNDWFIGVGYGIVRFDTKVSVTDKDSGDSYFLDLEGNLGLPEDSRIPTLYGSYRFNQKHSLVFGFFAIDRESTILDVTREFDDIGLVDARLTIEDNSSFYSISYGYNLFRDDRSSVTLVAGLNNMDLSLTVEASGQVIVDGDSRSQEEVADAAVFAPLPLLGLNFSFDFTPKWSIATRISLVRGSYEGTSAHVVQTAITSRYQFSRHFGLLFGMTYFDADVDISGRNELTEVSYGYTGGFIGLHAGF